MARIRVRFAANEGGQGAPLDKLADVAREAEKFLRMVAADLHIESRKGDWLAINFDEGGSVRFDAAFEAVPEESAVWAYTAAVRAITGYDPLKGVEYPGIRDETLEQYCRLGELMAPHERLGIGFYDGADGAPKEWKYLTRGKAVEIRQELERALAVYGSVQGVIHAWFMKFDPPFFQLRDTATLTLVKCLYPEKLYPTIVAALTDRATVVHAAGMGRFSRSGRALDELRVDRLEAVRPLSDEEFDRLFGADPGFTGEMTTAEYIEGIRGDWA